MHPGDVYVGHFTCDGRHTGEETAKQLSAFLRARGVDMDEVRVVGGDGTNQVVGWRGGWMACLERHLGRPLSRVVCLCHQAELPYRALFRSLDGQTVSPGAFAGPIGKRIAGPVHSLPMVPFAAVQCDDFPDLPPDVEADLSSDFRLLYQCARCVVSGDGTSVAHKTHGRVNMARWYTAQSRLLRLYMAEPSPSSELVTLVR